jgi:hypothetical protein
VTDIPRNNQERNIVIDSRKRGTELVVNSRNSQSEDFTYKGSQYPKKVTGISEDAPQGVTSAWKQQCYRCGINHINNRD